MTTACQNSYIMTKSLIPSTLSTHFHELSGATDKECFRRHYTSAHAYRFVLRSRKTRRTIQCSQNRISLTDRLKNRENIQNSRKQHTATTKSSVVLKQSIQLLFSSCIQRFELYFLPGPSIQF